MANASLYRKLGGLDLPAVVGDAPDGTLAGLDPGRDILLNLLKAALNAELGGAWGACTTGTPLSGAATPVMTAIPFIPDANTLLQEKLTWPVLCVYRAEDQEGAFSEFTLSKQQYVSKIAVDYLLGPLTLGDYRKLGDVLVLAAKTIALTIRRGGHPAYKAVSDITFPDGSTKPNNGNAVGVLGSWDGGAGFSIIKLQRVMGGQAQLVKANESPKYLALSMMLEVTEISDFSAGYAPQIDGATFALGTGDQTGLIPNLVEAITEAEQQAPFGTPAP